MKSVFYLLDTAPYGSEKAFGALNAAAVSLNGMNVTLGPLWRWSLSCSCRSKQSKTWITKSCRYSLCIWGVESNCA